MATDADAGAVAPALWVIGLGLASLAMANNMIIPLLGPIGRDVGLSDQQIGAIHAVAALVVIAAAPGWGRRSDKMGRRSVFAASLFGFAASTFALALTLQYALVGELGTGAVFGLLVMSRLAYGALGSGALPAAAGFLADISRPEDRLKAMTLPSRAFALGGLAGLCLIWPAAAVLGFTGPIFLVACLGAAVGTGALVLIDDRRVYLHGPQCNDSLWIDRPVGPHPRQHGLLAVNMLAFSCVSLIQTTVPFLVQDQFGLQMGETISFSTGLGLTLSLSTLAALRVARIPGPAYGTRAIWLAASGLSVAAMGACALYAGGFPAVLFLAHALIGFGFGLFVPSTQCLLSIRTSQGEQAHAAGRLSAAATAGYVIGPLVGAFLYADIGPWIYLISMAVLAALAACLLVQRPRKRLHASIKSRPDTP